MQNYSLCYGNLTSVIKQKSSIAQSDFKIIYAQYSIKNIRLDIGDIPRYLLSKGHDYILHALTFEQILQHENNSTPMAKDTKRCLKIFKNVSASFLMT